MSTVIQTDVPLVSTPFVNPQTGAVTEAWFIFLIQLWRRTGGGGGVIPDQLTLDDVLSVEQTFGVPSADTYGQIFANEATRAEPSRQEALFEMIFATPSTSSVDIVDKTFSSGVDFTPGVTTALTLSRSFGSIPRLWVFFDGAFQGDDQILSLVGTTLTFTAAIPVGVSKVYVKGLVLG